MLFWWLDDVAEECLKAYDATIEHADDLTDAWKENGGDLEAPEIVRLLDLRETAVLELYISVLDHFTKDIEYDSVLVSFLTVLSVRADDDSGSESDSDEDSLYDLQAGHGSKTAGLIYGRLVTEGAFETNERRVNFRYISEEWHRLLGFLSAIGGFGGVLTPGRKRKNVSICDEALRKLQLERWKSRRRINIDRELIYLYGE
ncbi:uncharacterized protein FFFS_11157 [Fusarium fujikuroi]|nr:uncharacterized protein FFFS_11157 [Fusarium fujikuroi]